MISENLLNLFQFIDFLHSNIDNFNQCDKLLLEWKIERWKERQFRQHYSEKLKMREVQKVIKVKWNKLNEQLIEPIKRKAIEIDVSVLDNPKTIFTVFSHDIVMLVENFHKEDVDEIMKVKRQYIEIRNDINPHIILLLKDFFLYFHELMKHLVRIFSEDGDRAIPKITDIYLDDYFSSPERFKLPLIGLKSKTRRPHSKTINNVEPEYESNDEDSPTKLKPLFIFIDFLHANIDNFNQYNTLISELYREYTKIDQLGTHFREVRKKKALQKEINTKQEVIDDNIINPLKNKVAELDLFDWNKPESLSNNYLPIASTLSKNFDDKELDTVLKAKTQYIEFTNKINTTIINLSTLLFDYLYEVMAEIARDFKEEGDKPIKNLDSAVEVKEEQNIIPQAANIPEATRENKQPLYTPEPQKYRSKHYALSFIFDCLATKVDYGSYDGKKSKLESIGVSRVKGAISGNTFYKAYNRLMDRRMNFEDENDLIDFAGDNWREIIIELSHEPEELDNYLKSNNL